MGQSLIGSHAPVAYWVIASSVPQPEQISVLSSALEIAPGYSPGCRLVGIKLSLQRGQILGTFIFFSFSYGRSRQVVLYRFNGGFPPPSVLKTNNIPVNGALYAACNSATVFDFPDWLVINELVAVMAVAPTRAPELYHCLSPCLRNE
jgi:hypothetical protein